MSQETLREQISQQMTLHDALSERLATLRDESDGISAIWPLRRACPPIHPTDRICGRRSAGPFIAPHCA